MPKLTRKEFVDAHANQNLDLKKLDKASKDAVVKADLNKDGKISGATEMNALFSQVDRFDKDGFAASVALDDGAGNKTAPGKLIEALGPGFASKNQAIADAALDRIAKYGANYGVAGAWKCPNPNMPGNRRPDVTEYSAMQGKWKCNLFANDCLYQAGFMPATYTRDGKGWYPIATDLVGFSTGPNRVFDNLGALKLNSMTAEQKQAEVTALLKQAQPGDLIIVNHQGPDQADGGHCRVVVGNNFEKDGTVACAQASFDAAGVKDEGVSRFTGEEVVYLLRPCRMR